MLELYDKALEKEARHSGMSGITERRTALVGTLAEYDEERRGYLRQNARGVLSDRDLDVMLAEVDEKRKVTASKVRRLEASRESLLTEDWGEDPDALQPGDLLSFGSHPKDIRAAYMSYGARFEVDQHARLTLCLELHLGGGSVANGSQVHGNEHWEFAENGLMRRRDASINDYWIDESARRYRG